MKNIVLIGFMGTGKTTIATKLAHALKMRYVSIDDLIEKREKCTINEIFEKRGEDYFRDVECEVVRAVSDMDGMVIDTGGGVVLRGENIENLKARGMIVCLTASPEVIMSRTMRYKHRPLLNVEDPRARIRSLLAKREPLYAKAGRVIDTGEMSIRQVVEKIVELFDAGTKPGKARSGRGGV